MDISNITLRNLAYIVAVAEERHFGRAAKRCSVSQPALSSQIQKLEASLDTTIFERGAREIRITPNGETIIEHARRVLDEVRLLATAAVRVSSPLSGEFRLGIIATLAAYLLPHLLARVRQIFPRLELVLIEGLTDHLLDKLRSGVLDAVLASPPLPAGNFQIEHLFVEPFLLAVPAGHRLGREPMLTPQMLRAQEMILLEDGHCLRDQALAICPSQDRSLRDRFRATSLETLRHMVATGIGYTLIPALAVPAPALPGGLVEYRKFSKDPPSRTISMVSRRGSAAAEDAHELSLFIRGNLPSAVGAAQL
ncbi:MAG TPA: LysR substrate-binding domain-containing protein [Spirochaetia bacterium]|nr:LysR substrate-binding domain-containing protein [Spirochaetia bacterium]